MSEMSEHGLDYVELYNKFLALAPGKQAQIKRHIKEPEMLRDIPAFYTLFSGIHPTRQHRRLAYFLPVCTHKENGGTLGAQLAKNKVSEVRLFQVVRSDTPNDLIQLRRICQHIQPQLDWNKFGNALWFWGEGQKRQLVEDYFTTLYGVQAGVKEMEDENNE